MTIALPDCARHLARLRPSHPAPHLVSNLIVQIKSYEDNPDGLRPRIIASVEQIEAAGSSQ